MVYLLINNSDTYRNENLLCIKIKTNIYYLIDLLHNISNILYIAQVIT